MADKPTCRKCGLELAGNALMGLCQDCGSEWALTRAWRRLLAEFEAAGGSRKYFEAIAALVTGQTAAYSTAQLAAAFGVTERTLKFIVFRLRYRLQQLLREERANISGATFGLKADWGALIELVRSLPTNRGTFTRLPISDLLGNVRDRQRVERPPVTPHAENSPPFGPDISGAGRALLQI